MAGLIGKKVGMTSIFSADGKNIPCTVIEAGPCVITQVKTIEKDGYEAVQLAFDEKPERKTNKPMMGHFKKTNTTPKRKLAELKSFNNNEVKLGETVTVDIFKGDVLVDITSTSKGKGFQGVVKRYNFKGVNDATHGQHNRNRAPGSLGASSFPSRVFKGMRMAGRDGGKTVKIFDLEVVKIMSVNNLLFVKGSVPGANGSYLIIED